MVDERFKFLASLLFALAILHVFMAPQLRALSRKRHSQALHIASEIELVFGFWAILLLLAMLLWQGPRIVWNYLSTGVSFHEPLFVVLVMIAAATRPVLNFAETCLQVVARAAGGSRAAWWFTILTVAPLLGSLITEPAAMTIAAIMLGTYFYVLRPSFHFAYATLGLLFVNVSVGGILTNFAAPPVLMVAGPWQWSSQHMLMNFGWKAVIGILCANFFYLLLFFRQFALLATRAPEKTGAVDDRPLDKWGESPWWLTLVHVAVLGLLVAFAHNAGVQLLVFAAFLVFHRATRRHQEPLNLQQPLLVGAFLAGLVVLGSLQGWWLAPILSSLQALPLMLAATVLTAFNDNAAITFLSTLVPGLGPELKYAIVAGAVTGGGLTVIANAPNPAGQALLAKYFPAQSISPLWLFIWALPPTLILGVALMCL